MSKSYASAGTLPAEKAVVEGSSVSFAKKLKKLSGVWPPLAAFVVVVGLWELICRQLDVAIYLLPKPSDIVQAAVENGSSLSNALLTTATETVIGFIFSVLIGVGFAIILASSKLVEKSVYPYAIVLQTIPIIAIAPIIVIWFGAGTNAIVFITFLIGFFPMLSNTLIGLNSTDHNMKNLFFLYNATPLQTMWRLRLPAALPYIIAGLKISATLSVIGAIVGEYMAGLGGANGGLGYAITVAATRLRTPYLFACGLSASILGIVFYLIVNRLSRLLLSSWHESELAKEN
ncbi:ABC transporter permease [Paenibacillus sp. HB172176]|uniref:ABC transporter permease n=1 Tax=Paenibacillus sp. HB172176 TaxID=2493690 RepID=UPI00143B2C74|nr:ABC transporter permease [Paenibacillus sp. HB172176]